MKIVILKVNKSIDFLWLNALKIVQAHSTTLVMQGETKLEKVECLD